MSDRFSNYQLIEVADHKKSTKRNYVTKRVGAALLLTLTLVLAAFYAPLLWEMQSISAEPAAAPARFQAAQTVPVNPEMLANQEALADLYDQITPSVVSIQVAARATTMEIPGFNIPQDEAPLQQGQGSGFIYDNEGHIVTNNHVIQGADTFRGFAVSGVGPRQVGNDGSSDAIGGRTYAIGTVEVSFPLGIPQEWGIEGAVFSDFGTVFNSGVDSVTAGEGDCDYGRNGDGDPDNDVDCDVEDTAELRATVGAGLIWQSPFGPLRFEAAYPLMKADYDETEWFRFSVGSRF